MNLFSRLQDLLSPPKPSTTSEDFRLPFTLTPEEWTRLRRLPTSEGWDVYLKVLDSLIRLDGERILNTSTNEVLHYVRGHVGGLRKAASIIEEISGMERHHDKEKSRQRHVRERDSSSLYGTPGWRPQSQRDASGV